MLKIENEDFHPLKKGTHCLQNSATHQIHALLPNPIVLGCIEYEDALTGLVRKNRAATGVCHAQPCGPKTPGQLFSEHIDARAHQ